MGRRRRRNGRDTLDDIDRRAYTMRSDINDFSKNISRIEQDLEKLNQEEAQIYLRLAEVRLDFIDDPDIVDKISIAERRAGEIMLSRSASRQKLDQELKDNQAEQKAFEKERQFLLARLDQFRMQAEEAKASSLAKLRKDIAYLEILGRIKVKQKQIERTDHKIEVSRSDYKEKSKPYHTDELFVYLNERQYGLSGYKASALISTLDQWVAGLIRYDEARRNYNMLLSIPGKLLQYKQILQKQLDGIEQEKIDYQQAFYKKDGTLVDQESYLKQKEAIDSIDAKIRHAALEQDRIVRLKTSEADQVDETYGRAIETLKNLYINKSLESLRHYALLSAPQEDDELVSRLISIEKWRNDQNASLVSYKRTVADLNQQYQRLEEARGAYKNRGYDTSRTVFNNDGMFGVLLGEFLVGVLSNRQLWRAVGEIIEDVFDDLDFD